MLTMTSVVRIVRALRPAAILSSLVAIGVGVAPALGQGVTTGALGGFVRDASGQPLDGAVLVAVHEPSGTRYSTLSRAAGAYTIPNMRVGGPYSVSAQMIGFVTGTEEGIVVQLGQTIQIDFSLQPTAIELAAIVVTADPTLNADRTGAATFVEPEAVAQMPSIRRSTRDLIRTDPRNDGNLSFAGRNWLFNNVSLDGSYFSNPFGLDDPAPGGQANAEPIPFESVEQVQVSVAPFDVRQGGFTGANVNTVTKSGTNDFTASAYTYYRNETFIGNQVRGQDVVANPDLKFNQSGFTAAGPISRDKLFFFLNGEIERRDDPGTDFVADTDGNVTFGESRVSAATMDAIRNQMINVYGYDPGAYQGYVHETNSNKVLAKLDWNVNDSHNLMFRYSYLDGSREQGPHPFVLSFNNAGRGPNASSLPFSKAGYRINNKLHSFALELNSRFSGSANRFFASYNRFRDFREPFSEDFPTVEIGEGGVGYTTLGHEPFSIHNILDQDVLQLTNNFTLFRGRHDLTVGANFEWFGFFNSFNIFRHGVFFLPSTSIGSTFPTVADFFAETAGGAKDLNGLIGSGPFKGENIDVGQLSLYVQDEFRASPTLALTAGVRVDLPMYFTDPVDNAWSRGLTALDGQGNPETVDQSALPGASPLFSPRVGFNWDVRGDRSTQVRGGTGVFTGRIPFVWFGNVISNPGANPDIWSPFNTGVTQVPTSDDAILQQSFDLNTMDPDFKWPQVWVTDIAVDQRLPWDIIGTLEVIYGSDINGIIMRNADLVAPVRTLGDGRPYYGGFGANELNADGGAGIYVIDNTDEGNNVNVTAQLRKSFENGLSASLSYSFTEAKNALKSTEIASVLWQNQPVQGNPNAPEVSWSEFGQRHRIVATATHTIDWSATTSTHLGIFFEIAQGNRFTAAGGNRYSFIYAGDVNGDGYGGNDLIYIPRSQSEINLADPNEWAALDAFIEQDDYLSANRGRIAERMGALNPWYNNIDLRVLQDFNIRAQTLTLSLDILNLANLINSDWGVRKVANPAATSPLALTGFDGAGEPIFDFTAPAATFIDDPSIFSRWQMQIGAKLTVN